MLPEAVYGRAQRFPVRLRVFRAGDMGDDHGDGAEPDTGGRNEDCDCGWKTHRATPGRGRAEFNRRGAGPGGLAILYRGGAAAGRGRDGPGAPSSRLRGCRRRRWSGARALFGGAGRGAGLRRRRGRSADELGQGRHRFLVPTPIRFHRLGMPVFLGFRPALVRFRPMPFGFRPAPILNQHADTENPDTQGRNGRGRGGSEGSLRRHSGSGEAGHLIFVHAGEAMPARPGTARGRPTPRDGRRDAGGGPGVFSGRPPRPVFETGATVRTPPPRGNAPRCETDSIAAGGGDEPPVRIRAMRGAAGSPRIRRRKATTATLSALLPPLAGGEEQRRTSKRDRPAHVIVGRTLPMI